MWKPIYTLTEANLSKGGALSWDTKPERKSWSQELLATIPAHLEQLEVGNPEQFVAGYVQLSQLERVGYWAELFIAIAKFESSWKPNAIYHEPPPLGVDSIGLLQLSYEDEAIYRLERLDRAKRSLEDPLVNLRCGVKILASLLTQDRMVAFSNGNSHRGGARYWSVLRPGLKHHLEEIKALLRQNAVR